MTSTVKSSSESRLAVAYRRVKAASIGIMALAALACAFGSPAFSGQSQKTKASHSQTVTKEDDRIIHVLNRLGFGARPDDVAKIRRIGIDKYIDQQLHPESIDDSVVDQKLKSFAELQLSDGEIEAKYKDFITADQNVAKLRRTARKNAAKDGSAAKAADGTMLQTVATGSSATPPTPPDPKAKREARKEMMDADPMLAKEVEDNRVALAAAAEPIGLLHQEFTAAKLIRATESQRQLQEVLVDFWSNHFNIDIRKAPCGVLKVLDDRDVIRPHILGKFRDLLEASAKSPAMLVHLDNFQSVADQPPQQPNLRQQRQAARLALQGNGAQGAQAQVVQKPKKRAAGLNENYAREIMELHTLGVDGGYTQKDVHEVARCFTGWGLGSPDGARTRMNRYGEAGEFQFFPRLHDNGEKVVMGQVIPAGGGIEDGERVLDILANSVATRRHVSYELCQRLVCDEPPASLVQKCMNSWQKTDGDLREVVKTIVTSTEFYSPVAMRKKIKSPFEYAISSVRALDGTLEPTALVSARQITREANGLIKPPKGGGFLDINTNTLLGQIATMGEPLFQYQAPTGFPEDSRKWVSSGALISRLNFSLALTQGRILGVKIENPAEDAGGMDAEATINRLAARILNGDMTASTRATLESEAKPGSGAPITPATIAALLLGSPEFQRR